MFDDSMRNNVNYVYSLDSGYYKTCICCSSALLDSALCNKKLKKHTSSSFVCGRFIATTPLVMMHICEPVGPM